MLLNQSLIDSNITALKEGADLLALLKAEQYTTGLKPVFHSTIGAHFRHVLEHFRCLFQQLQSGIVCYDDRERDQLLECDRDYAKRTIHELIDQLNQLEHNNFLSPLQMKDIQAPELVCTTLHRELLFLQSHTAHHYAIIGAMSRSFGAQPEDDFGVAIATREHQKSQKTDRTIGDSPSCAQ